MKKILVSAIAVLVLSTGLIAAAHAAASGWDRVKSINQFKTTNSAGKTVFEFEGTPCPSGSGTWYVPSDANQELMLRVLVSAMLSGRRAHANYTAQTDGCQVYSVSLGGF